MIRKLTGKDYAVSAWSGGTTTQLAIYPENAVYGERDFLWRVSSALVELEESDFTPLPDYDRLIATLEGEIVLSHNGGAPLRLRPLEVHAFSGADATHSWGRCKDFNLMLRRGRASGTMEPIFLTQTPTLLAVGTAETSPACREGGAPRRGAEEGCRSYDAPLAGASICRPPEAKVIPDPCETLLLYCAEGSCSVGAANGRPPDASTVPFVGAVTGRPQSAPSFPISLCAGETLLCTDPIPLTLTGPATLMLCRITTR